MQARKKADTGIAPVNEETGENIAGMNHRPALTIKVVLETGHLRQKCHFLDEGAV